jgi:hypothetical protein
MRLSNNYATVTIEIDQDWPDIKKEKYDSILGTDKYDNNLIRALAVLITNDRGSFSYLLIGSCYSSTDNCAVLDNDKLLVLMDETLMVFEAKEGQYLLKKEYDQWCSYFELHMFDDAYLIYGEGEIVKLDREYNAQWRFSGSDIFVLPTGNEAFSIHGNTVQVYDFLGNFYEIDKNGMLIYEQISENHVHLG